MGHQRDARILDGLITATLEGRDEDDVSIGGQHHLRIEVALCANLHNTTVFHPLQDVLVEEVLGARHALHHVVGIENGEVRQLQGRHTNGVLDGYANLRVTVRYGNVVRTYQRKVVVLADIHQTNACRVAHTECSGILHRHCR